MDHESLRTASTYLNNLLLARGLLRNSEPIDFVKPSKESRAQIINLVHDLILREDRDREQREHVAVTIRTLRSDETRKNGEIERLKTKNEETSRALAQAQAAERSAQAELKRVEKVVKGLQDQVGKMKTALVQVRSQCTNDVRKRDLEIARLKTHLQGQQRGNKVGVTAPSITITGGARRPAAPDGATHELDDPEYSLKQETTEFLTKLSQSLSDENDNLISLIRDAVGSMREVLGLPVMTNRHPDSAIGSIDSHEDVPSGNHAQETTNPNMLHPLATSHQALSATMEATLTHLKSILTNPNFVSMDEVVMRDEEIARLRFGWERMEFRWKEVLHMMEAWKRKMDTGYAINIDDLRRGIGLVSPENMGKSVMGAVREEGEGESFASGEVSEIKLPGNDAEPDSSMLAGAEQPALLEGKRSPKRKRDVMEPPEFFDLRPSTQKASLPTSPEPPEYAEDESPLASDSEEVDAPRMTVAEKLDRARTEAEQAAATRTQAPATSQSLAAKSSNTSKLPRPTMNGAASFGLDGVKDNTEGDDTLGKMPPSPAVAKRAGIRGRPKKRRKSTLSPEELEDLIAAGGDV